MPSRRRRPKQWARAISDAFTKAVTERRVRARKWGNGAGRFPRKYRHLVRDTPELT